MSQNRLHDELSPYLLQHAEQAIHWQPWDSTALDAARQRDCPILLSIGYAACHWCHVMAREAFSDAEIAAALNQHFVCIKVDREERPDLDRIGQQAHQLLTASGGGWPLTQFLDPHRLLPFFSGTYFPLQPRYGLPGFADLLQQVRKAWADKRHTITEQGGRLQLQLNASPQHSKHDNPAANARKRWASSFDADHGGFGTQPKFPQPGTLAQLLRLWARGQQRGEPDGRAKHMALHSLRRMAASGVYDQLGGGFFRYSVDAAWQIPHFEKMLSDNALLLTQYADAWQITQEPAFKRIASETADCLLRDFALSDGGFASSLDADCNGVEGGHYLWHRNEAIAILQRDEYRVFAARFGFDRPPNCDQQWHLRQQDSLAGIEAKTEISSTEAQRLLWSAKQKLLTLRQQRSSAPRDDKVITSQNALTLTGLARCGKLLARPELLDAAIQQADWLWAERWQQERLIAVYRQTDKPVPGFLDDYAFLLQTCLELLQARWDSRWLHRATLLADALLQQFTAEAGGFHFTASDAEPLPSRLRPDLDEATPSGNGIAASALLRLTAITGKPEYEQAARSCQTLPGLQQLPQASASLLDAMDEAQNGLQTLVLKGQDDSALQHWHGLANQHYCPWRITLALPNNSNHQPDSFAAMHSSSRVTAWFCAYGRCAAPITDLQSYRQALRR